jgi:hypothetical protein
MGKCGGPVIRTARLPSGRATRPSYTQPNFSSAVARTPRLPGTPALPIGGEAINLLLEKHRADAGVSEGRGMCRTTMFAGGLFVLLGAAAVADQPAPQGYWSFPGTALKN